MVGVCGTVVAVAVVGTAVGAVWLETINCWEADALATIPVTVNSYWEECSGFTVKLQRLDPADSPGWTMAVPDAP